LGFFVLIPLNARGETLPAPSYYVALSGSDDLPCSAATNPDTPKRTLNGAVGCLTPGSVLYVRGGVYAEQLWDAIPSGSSWDAPVTIAAYPGESATLQPPDGADRVLHFQNNHQYIVIDGLVLDGVNVSSDAVKITYGSDPATAAHHIRIQNSEVKNAPGQGILDVGPNGHNEFLNLRVHDNGGSAVSYLQHGIYIAAPNDLVAGSNVYANAGYGIQIQYDWASGTVVRASAFHDNQVGGIVVASGPADVVLMNNLVFRNFRIGVQVTYGTSRVHVYNNTIVDNSALGWYGAVLLDEYAADTDIRNNIAYRNAGGAVWGVGGPGTIVENNLFDVAPRFVNAAGNDFHLRPSSPAIGIGVGLLGVTEDADGVTRPPIGSSAGAYEFVPAASIDLAPQSSGN
jgi:hypothetical protein